MFAYLSIYLSISPSIYLSIHPSIYLSIDRSIYYLSICLSIYLFYLSSFYLFKAGPLEAILVIFGRRAFMFLFESSWKK